MPDFIGKLGKEVIFNNKKPIFLKNLNIVHVLNKKLKKEVLLKMAKTKSQAGFYFVLKILANFRLMSLINWSLIKKKCIS